MKKTILLLAILIGMQSCKSGQAISGKEHVRIQHANANYNMDKWAKEYRKLNNSKPKKFYPVTLQKAGSMKVPSPIRP